MGTEQPRADRQTKAAARGSVSPGPRQGRAPATPAPLGAVAALLPLPSPPPDNSGEQVEGSRAAPAPRGGGARRRGPRRAAPAGPCGGERSGGASRLAAVPGPGWAGKGRVKRRGRGAGGRRATWRAGQGAATAGAEGGAFSRPLPPPCAASTTCGAGGAPACAVPGPPASLRLRDPPAAAGGRPQHGHRPRKGRSRPPRHRREGRREGGSRSRRPPEGEARVTGAGWRRYGALVKAGEACCSKTQIEIRRHRGSQAFAQLQKDCQKSLMEEREAELEALIFRQILFCT